ncbi:MAG: TIGR03619 family F420-dependent LLM class oxidoreductase [Proteobacteria bacterium]|nr:TIGR03619 family F420-dependent LLM class oxidoreductase [Pseudomonadota bacterium]
MRIGVSLPVRELAGDLVAIRDFAQLAEGLGLTHLRVPEQVLRPGSGHLHESMTILTWVAAQTSSIELVPSVIILPSRQTALFAKQAAELDIVSGGRLRLGIGVGNSQEEYGYMGVDFHSRGRRCSEQMQLLKQLWTRETVNFEGEFDTITGVGLNPLPVQQPIPLWIGARAVPSASVIRRIGQLSDGWFNLASPEDFPRVRDAIYAEADAIGRASDELGIESGVAVVGEREHEWKDRVVNWKQAGLTHLCLRTLGGGLNGREHHEKLQQAVSELPDQARD